jgi:hypothetical protein
MLKVICAYINSTAHGLSLTQSVVCVAQQGRQQIREHGSRTSPDFHSYCHSGRKIGNRGFEIKHLKYAKAFRTCSSPGKENKLETM